MATPFTNAASSALADEKMRAATRFWIWQVGLLAALILAILFAVGIGAVEIPLPITTQVIGSHLLPGWIAPVADPTQDQIIWVFRLPRVLLAVIVGAALAMTRNPLSDPYIFGVSSGASVGAVLVITLGSTVMGGCFALASRLCRRAARHDSCLRPSPTAGTCHPHAPHIGRRRQCWAGRFFCGCCGDDPDEVTR